MPEKRSGYTPVYATGVKSEDFKNFHRVLVDDEDKFDRMLELWDRSDKSLLAFDTETNSCLNPEEAKLVGCSLAFNREYGFYMPFYHVVGETLDIEFFGALERMLHEAQMVLYYNTRFDLRIQRKYGHDISKIKDFDMSIPVWNWDTNVKMPALKKIAVKYILGWDLETYEQKFGKTQNLSMYFPEEVVDYAVYDSIALLHLYDKCAPIMEEAQFPISLDNSLTRAIMHMEDRPHPIDNQLLEDTSEEVLSNIRRLEQEIYQDIGYDFKITSHEQLARELQRLGLDTGEYTEQKKTMKTGLKYLKRLEGKHPVVTKIMEFKKLNKLHNSFISSLIESYREDLGGCRFSYHLNDAPTGRLASGNDKKNSYFGNLNIQAITKSGSQEYLAVPAIPGDSRAVLGYSFLPLDKAKDDQGNPVYYTKSGRRAGRDIQGILTEGQRQENNVRSAFLPRADHWFVHFDYKAQELRIPANIAQDEYLTQTFISGKDPHREVAILMFGEDAYDKDKRKIAKTLNFSSLYGASKYTIAERLGCSVDEAMEYMMKWWKIQSGLRRWRDKTEKQGEVYSFVKTAFGRIRRVGYWFQKKNESGGQDFRALGFAKRTCVNTIIQGSAGDMMRIALLVLDSIMEYPEDDFQILSTVHDEINFSIRKDLLGDAVPRIQEVMQHKLLPDWKVDMEVDMEVGTSWGWMFPFRLENGVFVPNGEVLTRENPSIELEIEEIFEEDDEENGEEF